ncbi:class I SAM-dependent methyltransferase [Fulvivirga lutimaris]|uniref:class I SAM-dependent methyltransferase n=1 Tax=Fulvivirga lutimaris TaxID=1819566 RepID=UPI0012BC1833|nr:class I SAM-dependent methyltransferase [Fulvivirga lutimaris]MTI38048.1 class I SAM-dependent methyltransferase [Fulvivirga lutimaris]
MLKKVLKRLIKRPKKKQKSELDFSSEEEYYEYLFTTNTKWSSKLPNKDEAQRWNAIFGHINYLKAHSQNKDRLSILDLGSGRGWLSNLLSKYGEVVGIEPVKPVVEFSKKLYPDIEFYSGFISEYKSLLKEKELDLIVCSEVIEHVPDKFKIEFCSDLFEVLSENGYLILTTPRNEIQKEYVAAYGNPGQPIEEWVGTEEVEKMFELVGFTSLNYIGVNLPHLSKCPDLEIYQTWLFKK